MSVYLLIMWMSYREGYITIPNLPSREECVALRSKLLTSNASPYKNSYWDCIEYRVKP